MFSRVTLRLLAFGLDCRFSSLTWQLFGFCVTFLHFDSLHLCFLLHRFYFSLVGLKLGSVLVNFSNLLLFCTAVTFLWLGSVLVTFCTGVTFLDLPAFGKPSASLRLAEMHRCYFFGFGLFSLSICSVLKSWENSKGK